jgi:uncharacterized membrane protein
MEKTEFLKRLEEQLYERGLDPDSVKEQVERVTNYITQTGMDDIDVDPSEMADGIVKAVGNHVPIQEECSSDTAAEEIVDDDLTFEDEINDAIKTLENEDGEFDVDFQEDGENQPLEDDASASEESEEESFSEDEDLAPGFVRVMAPEDVQNDVPDDNIDDVRPYRPARNERDKKLMRKHNKKEYDEESRAEREERKMELSEEDLQKLRNNKTLFIVLACVAVPIVLALALIVVGLYLFFWIALALAMIFSIAALIVFIAAGACVSLIGIVYGVIQLVAGLTPIGLFEIGLGIIVGGSVLLIGILVYNFAMRLIPFGMKQLARLFKFAFCKGRDAYIMAKGVCEKL